jgi:hypothetical protein
MSAHTGQRSGTGFSKCPVRAASGGVKVKATESSKPVKIINEDDINKI